MTVGLLKLRIICVFVRCLTESNMTANSAKNWQKYGAVQTESSEGGLTAVEFKPQSHDAQRHRSSDRRPSLALALFRTFIGYFAWSGVLMIGYSLIMFINPFLLK